MPPTRPAAFTLYGGHGPAAACPAVRRLIFHPKTFRDYSTAYLPLLVVLG